MKISIIGAGNGGQAMAGHFSLLGHQICLYDRDKSVINQIKEKGGIKLEDKVEGFTPIKKLTTSIEDTCAFADLIMVVTTANAHKDVAIKIKEHLTPNHTVILNPGRTLGALEFKTVLGEKSNKIKIAETQSLLYACRSDIKGQVRIIGIKKNVMVGSIPSNTSKEICHTLNSIYNCFIPCESILQTSLENIGAILHPVVVMFNIAAIERGNQFAFYNDLTPKIAEFIINIDKERLALGKALNIELHSIDEWVNYAYNKISGSTFLEKIRNNPAYYKIMAPTELNSRYITEDVPTGLLPYLELGKLLNVEMPLTRSVYDILSSVSGLDYTLEGRNLNNLGFKELSIQELLNLIT
jgi:opine dehydrogenase